MFQWFQGCDIIHERRKYFLRIRYRRKVSALRNFPQAFPRPTVKGDIQLLGIEMQRKRGEKWNVNKNTEMLKICVVNIHVEHLLCKWHFLHFIYIRYVIRLSGKTLLNSIEFSKYLCIWWPIVSCDSQFHGKQYKFTTLTSAPTAKVWMRYAAMRGGFHDFIRFSPSNSYREA